MLEQELIFLGKPRKTLVLTRFREYCPFARVTRQKGGSERCHTLVAVPTFKEMGSVRISLSVRGLELRLS